MARKNQILIENLKALENPVVFYIRKSPVALFRSRDMARNPKNPENKKFKSQILIQNLKAPENLVVFTSESHI